MTFFSFYAQPSCTPGRASMQTGRIPNRSGMTTVAFQGQGGGLPKAEWTLASVPQIFDLWQDPQERYDIFMNNYTERTWTLVTINEEVKNLMKTYLKYPPRKVQSEVYTGPVTLSQYQRFNYIREMLEKDGISLPLPTGN